MKRRKDTQVTIFKKNTALHKLSFGQIVPMAAICYSGEILIKN